MQAKDIVKGQQIFLVRANTAQDPLLCHKKMIAYNPLVIYKMNVATSVYDYKTVNGGTLPCFDVFGDHGTKNKGNSEGTRRVFLMDIGLNDNDEKDCLFSFLNESDAQDKVGEMLSKDCIRDTMIFSLKEWSINPRNDTVDTFIKMFNEL